MNIYSHAILRRNQISVLTFPMLFLFKIGGKCILKSIQCLFQNASKKFGKIPAALWHMTHVLTDEKFTSIALEEIVTRDELISD